MVSHHQSLVHYLSLAHVRLVTLAISKETVTCWGFNAQYKSCNDLVVCRHTKVPRPVS